MKQRRYYSLLIRDDQASTWSIHFGDFDHRTVQQEQSHICDHDHKKMNTKIICTDAKQTAIHDAVRKLNEALVPFDKPYRDTRQIDLEDVIAKHTLRKHTT